MFADADTGEAIRASIAASYHDHDISLLSEYDVMPCLMRRDASSAHFPSIEMRIGIELGGFGEM